MFCMDHGVLWEQSCPCCDQDLPLLNTAPEERREKVVRCCQEVGVEEGGAALLRELKEALSSGNESRAAEIFESGSLEGPAAEPFLALACDSRRVLKILEKMKAALDAKRYFELVEIWDRDQNVLVTRTSGVPFREFVHEWRDTNDLTRRVLDAWDPLNIKQLAELWAERSDRLEEHPEIKAVRASIQRRVAQYDAWGRFTDSPGLAGEAADIGHGVDIVAMDGPGQRMQRVGRQVEQGKARYIGSSNYDADQLAQALQESAASGCARMEATQPNYNLVVRDIEQELIPVCQLKGLGVVVWSPLGGGFLSGKYQPGERTVAGTRSADAWAYPQRYFAQNADESLQTLFDVAGEIGRTPAQIALRWVLEQPAITSIIIGARTFEQARENMLAGSFRLEGEALQKLNEVSYLPHRYPEEMEKDMHERRDDAIKMPSLE